jgi:hypothetical protein
VSQRRLPAEVYWRRRLLVLALLILLVWLGMRVWPDGDGEPAAAAPTATPTATQAPPTTNGVTNVALTTGSEPCDAESIRITPTVRSGQHARGPVTITLLVSSSSAKPCNFTARSSDLLVVISAGKTPVYDSTVCKASLLRQTVQLSPGWATSVDATWSGRGSGPRCSSKEGWATPGTYVLKIGTLGGEPGRTSFRLTSPPKPKATPTPTPTATPTKKAEKKKS